MNFTADAIDQSIYFSFVQVRALGGIALYLKRMKVIGLADTTRLAVAQIRLINIEDYCIVDIVSGQNRSSAESAIIISGVTQPCRVALKHLILLVKNVIPLKSRGKEEARKDSVSTHFSTAAEAE